MQGNHPDFVISTARCSNCGTEFTVRSTQAELVLDACSSCHPAYTGVERQVASGSRIARFERRRAFAVAY